MLIDLSIKEREREESIARKISQKRRDCESEREKKKKGVNDSEPSTFEGCLL